MIRRILFTPGAAMVLLVSPLALQAQERIVTGTVTSTRDGKPVAGATIHLKGAVQAAATDSAGRYRIVVPAGATEMLEFTHPEFDVLDTLVQGQSQFDVVLRSSARINQYGVKTERRPVDGEERGGFLVFESPDQNYRFWFDVRVQTDGAAYFGETPAPIGNGVMLRRLRFATKSQFTPHWYGELDMDFASGNAGIEDAYLMYLNRDFYLKIGNAKEVFSMETNTTSRYLTFMERPVGTKALTPSRRLGISAAKSLPLGLRAFGGVYFQEIGDPDQIVSREDNNEAFGRDEGHSVTGKLVLPVSFGHAGSGGLHLAAAGSYRTPTTDDVLGTMRFSGREVSYVNRKKYVDTDRIKNVDHSVLQGLEGSAFYKRWRLSSEFDRTTVTRTDSLAPATFNGGFVMSSVMLFGGHHRYNTGEGEFTQPTRGKKWGDIELAARFDYLDLNDVDAGIKGGASQTVTLGANWWVNNNVKFMANLGFVDHDRYANGRGKIASGFTADGKPTTNPQLMTAATGKGGNDYRVLALRCEVNF